jgi:hypothetical protein
MMNWKVARWIALSLVVLAVCALSWSLGVDHVQAKWDAEKAALAEAALKQERKDQAFADAVGAKVAASATKERVVYKTLIKEIPKYVESDCNLSGGFRVFHDAAANATVPDSSATGADAASVKAQDVAATVAENYESCRDNERRLEALQEIIKNYNSQ